MGYTALVSLVLLAVLQPKVSSANSCADDAPPRFTSDGQPPEARWVVFGVDGRDLSGDLILPCGVTGTPTPTVSWFRNGTLIDRTFMMADGTLSIRVTEAEAPSEGTNYYCVATNKIGQGNSTVATLRSRDVNISSVFFYSREASIATVVNGDVALECAFNGLFVNVKWFADGVMLTETGRIIFLENGRYLHIQDLNTAEREMRYHCEVNNIRDEIGMSVTAPTNYTLNADIPLDALEVYITENTRTTNNSTFLTFVAAGRGPDGTQVPVTLACFRSNFVTFEAATETTLLATLTEAGRREDQFNITCRVSSFLFTRIGEDVVGTIIVSGPEFPTSSANITDPVPNDSSLADRERLLVNETVVFSCVVSGAPPPTITWYYNSKIIVWSDIEDSTQLTILALQNSHSGIYQCFARNQLGEDSRAWILEVADPVIGVVTFSSTSTFNIIKKGQDDLLYIPSGSTDIAILATVNSTTIRGFETCDSRPEIQWKINETTITIGSNCTDSDYTASNSSSDDITGRHTFILTFCRFSPEFIGNYSVVLAFQGFSITRKSQGLIVTDSARPVITECTGAEEPDKSHLELQCIFLDVIQTSASWSKDGNIISDNDDRITITRVNGMSILRITAVTSDGVYTFMTTNEAGNDSRAVTVTVLEPPTPDRNSGRSLVGGFVAAAVIVLLVVAVQLFS